MTAEFVYGIDVVANNTSLNQKDQIVCTSGTRDGGQLLTNLVAEESYRTQFTFVHGLQDLLRSMLQVKEHMTRKGVSGFIIDRTNLGKAPSERLKSIDLRHSDSDCM